MMIAKRILIVLVVWIYLSQIGLCRNCILIQDDNSHYILNKEVAVFSDTTCMLEIQDFLHQPSEYIFVDSECDLIGETTNFWMRFTIDNRSNRDRKVAINFPHGLLQDVALYQVDRDHVIDSAFCGYEVNNQNQFYSLNHPVFFVVVRSGEHKDCYLKVRGSVQRDVKIEVCSVKAVLEKSSYELFFFGGVFGVLLALVFYNLALWRSTRLRGYMYCILSLVFVILNTFIYDGFIFSFFDRNYSALEVNLGLVITTSLSVSFNILFIQIVLRLREFYLWAYRIESVIIVVFVITILLAFFDIHIAFLTQDFLYLSNFLFVFIIALMVTYQKKWPSLYIVFSMLILLIVIGIDVLFYYFPSLKEGLPILLVNVFYVGICIESILLSLALTSYVKKVRIEKERLDIETEKKERELEGVRKNYTAQLEKDVNDRTLEVELKNEALRETTQKLKKLDQVKSRFFTNVSHELRTPLSLLIGYLHAILNKQYGEVSGKVLEYLHKSKRNGEHLLKLIEEILELSKIDANATKLKEKPVDIKKLIQRIVSISESSFESKAIGFKVTLQLENERVWLDEAKFEKVLFNLLHNASKFTDSGQVDLKVEVQHLDKQAVLVVRLKDSGRGIPEDEIDQIFDRYYQATTNDYMKQGGTGIGLSMVKELLEIMGGSITVCSQVGVGTEFQFCLPYQKLKIIDDQKDVIEPQELERSTSSILPAEEISTQGVILLVEDHEEMSEFIYESIPDLYIILHASNGVEALEILQNEKVDLIISDIMMPQMDGFQLLEIIKDSAEHASISIIMLTARADHEDRLLALQMGVDDYLTKPFDPLELNTRIQYLFTNRKMREDWIDNSEPLMNDSNSFLTSVEHLILDQISDFDLAVPDIADQLEVSQSQLFKKTKEATGLSPLQFIQEVRLQTAYKVLVSGDFDTISSVMHHVGYRKSDYFAKIFKKRFGKLPSSYLK